MKFLIIGEPNPNSHLQNTLKAYFPDTEFSLAFDAATLEQSLSQDGYDLVFVEKPLDQLSSPDLLQRLHRTGGQLPPVVVSAFEEAEDTFRTMLEALPDWLVWLGADGRYLFISSACETITGYRPEDFMADPKLVITLVHPDDRQRVAEHRQEILEHSNRACEFEFRLYHRNGELRWISHKCQPLFREGVWIGHFATNRDITDHKKAAEELNLSNQALLTLMNAPDDVVILVDREYKIVQVNQTLANRFGKRVDEIVGKNILDVLPLGSDLARSREKLARRVFATGQPARSEDVGVSGVFDNAYFPVLDEQGQVRLVAVIARDITQRKQVENELRQSYQTIQTLMNAPSDIAAVFDLDGKIQMANETLASALKHSVSDLTGKIIWDFFPPEMSQYRKSFVEKVKRTKLPERFVDHGIAGQYDSIMIPLLDENGNVNRVAILARDIGERLKAQEELRESYQTIQALLNAPTDIAVVFDLDGKIQMANETLAHILHHPVSELVGNILWDYFPAEIANSRKAVVEKVKLTKKAERTIDHGVFGLYDSILQPILDDNGNIARFALLARDISERLKAQEALSQREVMLTTIVNNAPVVLFVFDKAGNITFADGKAISVATHLGEQLIGENLLNTPNPSQVFAEGIRQALEGQDYSAQITTSSGYTFEARLTPMRNPTGEISGVICVGVDITENQKIQEELRHSKDELQVILDSVAETIAVINPLGELIYVNPAGIQLTGYGSIEALVGDIGRPDLLNMRDEAGNPRSWDELRRLLVTRGAVEGSYIFRLQPLNSNEERWISTQSTPIFDDKGELQFVIIIAHDLTDIKRTQTQLEAAQVELEKKITERTSELNLANQELVQRVAERQRAAANSEALAHVAARVNMQSDLPSTLQAICEEITRAVNYHYCSIFLYDEQRDEFRLATPSTQDEHPAEVLATPRALYEHYLRMYGPVIVIPDRQALPEAHDAQMMVQYDVRTLISVPLTSNGELIGNLNVASANEVRLPSPEELSLLVALADQASIAISKARLFEQVSESRKRLQFLSEKLVEIQEAERRNLARELHDEIGQLLTSLRLNLDLAVRAMPPHQLSVEEAQKQLTRANETATQLLGRIREISLDLRPTLLDDLGLLPALLVQFERFTAQTNIQVHFKHSGLENRFSSQIETVAFRVVQEALTNVTRHARTGEAYVRLWADPQFLRLQVEDHGVGFDPQVALTSNLTSGLSGMQERVSLCNGQFEIESEPGQGTCLTVELPLK